MFNIEVTPYSTIYKVAYKGKYVNIGSGLITIKNFIKQYLNILNKQLETISKVELLNIERVNLKIK